MLRVRLLGALEVELDRAFIESPASQRPWSLFAYLALSGRPVPRSELAARFWPDVLDQSARASLRSALWTLRRKLGDAVVVDGERVSLADAWVDVHELDRLADADPEQALTLCRGELLEGVDEEWAMLARQEHRERVIELLERLALEAEARGDHPAALVLTRRQLERDPLDEAVARRLMTRLELAGDRAGAVRVYRALGERLRRELGVAPSARTRELAAQLQQDPEPAPPAGTSSSIPGRNLRLVGREAELRALTEAWERAAGGTGTVAVIVGPAGFGKSRLAAELHATALERGAVVARGGALDLGGLAPLSLWAEIIGELLPRISAPPPEAAWPIDLALLGVELPAHFAQRGLTAPAVAPDLQRTRLFEAVVSLIGWSARRSPVLLVLEDVHGADGPSLELAGYAARRLAGLPVLILLTRRPLPRNADADQLEHVLRARGLLTCLVELERLDGGAVARLAREVARLSDDDVEHVVRGAEGNPLLAVESARALARGQPGVAASLRTLVRAALAPLSHSERELVELLAVAARPVGVDEIDLVRADARAMLDTGMIIDTLGGVGFRHALLRDAVYEEIAPTRRAALHRWWTYIMLERPRAGAVGRAAEIARQLRLAGAHMEAIPHLVQAASEARNVGALAEAAAFVEEAIGIAESVELWLELGELEAWRGLRAQAEAAFNRASALSAPGPPLERVHVLLRRARAYHGPLCVPRAVLDGATAALALLDECDEPCDAERSEALAARTWSEAVAGNPDEAERLLLELGTRPTSDARVYDIGHARALVLMRRGQFHESYGPAIAAGEAASRADRPDLAYGCWANAAGAAAAAGEHERALEFIERGMTALEGHGLQTLEAHLLGARSFVLRRLGRLEDAQATAEAEHALAEQLGHPELLAMASHDRGLVALDRDQPARAAELLAGALIPGAPVSRPLTRLALAEALARAGDADGAAAQLRETVLEPIRPSDFPAALVPRLARAQGLVAVARGEYEEARRRFEEAIAGWERLLARQVRAETMTTVLADLGRPVVGLVEPERELARAQADLDELLARRLDAVVP